MKLLSFALCALVLPCAVSAQGHEYDPGGVALGAQKVVPCHIPDLRKEEHGLLFVSCGGKLIFLRNSYRLGAHKTGDMLLCQIGTNITGTEVAESCQQRDTAAVLK